MQPICERLISHIKDIRLYQVSIILNDHVHDLSSTILSTMSETSPTIIAALQATAITTSALYTGFTFAYSHVAIPPMTTHAPPKLLAKQWLQAYQFAPAFVAPLILLAASSNALLAYLTTSRLYVVAALANASIVPYTALYMEPGINGAGKWKAQEILRDEGWRLEGTGAGTERDSASQGAKGWAESVDMRTIVEKWGRVNAWRYVVTGVAMVVSAVGMVVGR